jgi:8-amino-7-oxononanoate synthase
MIGTLSKAAGSFGAFVAGDQNWIDHLVQHARPFIYTTALPPAIAAASYQSLKLISEQSWRRENLHQNIASFRKLAIEAGIKLMDSQTPIQSVVLETPTAAVEASAHLEQAGFLVIAIRPPTVPEGTSRLRITLSAGHGLEQIRNLVAALARG